MERAELLEPWQEPVRGGVMDPALLTLTGLEQLRAFASRDFVQAPVARLTGRRLTAVGAGTTTYVMPASEWLLGPKGRIHTGMLAFLADAPLATAILTALPARTPITTAELSMTFLGDPPPAGGNLLAQSKLVYADDRNGLSEVFITDGEGRLVGHGTSRCFIFPQVDLPDMPFSPVEEPVYDTPDPYLRPLPPEPAVDLPPGLSGLELMRLAAKGEIPLPPIDHLTGIRPLEADDGRVVFTMPASGWTMNEAGAVFGGIIACLAKSACSGAVQTIAPAGTRFTALDVKVNYLRPGIVGGDDLVATGTVVHRGRNLAIATAEVMQGEKRVAVATGSTALAQE